MSRRTDTCPRCGQTKDGKRLNSAALYCRPCQSAYGRLYRLRPQAAVSQKMSTKRWRENNKEQHAKNRRNDAKKHRAALRKRVLEAYSGQIPSCACCGESNVEFLAMDHVDGGGNVHRRAIGVTNGSSIYKWLERNGFPKGFQVLCHNCNFAKSHYGGCPHQRLKTEAA